MTYSLFEINSLSGAPLERIAVLIVTWIVLHHQVQTCARKRMGAGQILVHINP